MDSWIIILYRVIIYAVIAYNLSVQKKHQNVILKTALNIMANKRL